jgi:hypothetical protein
VQYCAGQLAAMHVIGLLISYLDSVICPASESAAVLALGSLVSHQSTDQGTGDPTRGLLCREEDTKEGKGP